MTIPSEIHINATHLGIFTVHCLCGLMEWFAQSRKMSAPFCGNAGKYSIAATTILGPSILIIRTIVFFMLKCYNRITSRQHKNQSVFATCNKCGDTGFVKFHNPNIRVPCSCRV